MKKNKLTIAIPTYNREKTLPRGLYNICREIAHKQSGIDVELLISDNHSEDRTPYILNLYESNYSFVRVVKPLAHLKSGEENIEFLIDESDSDYIWTLADDDLIEAGSLDKILEIIYANKEIDFFLLNASYVDLNSIKTERLIDTKSEIIVYERFKDLLVDVGSQTILALFSSHVFKTDFVKNHFFEKGLYPATVIYSHVFRYLEVFKESRSAIIGYPYITAVQTTANNHWTAVSRSLKTYIRHPWVGGMLEHLKNSVSKGLLDYDDVSNCLNSNENLRYGLLTHILSLFLQQVSFAVEVRDSNELPKSNDAKLLFEFCINTDYIQVDVLNFLMSYIDNHNYLIQSIDNIWSADASKSEDDINSIFLSYGFSQFSNDALSLFTNYFRSESTKLFNGLNDIGSKLGAIKPSMIWESKESVVFRYGSKYVAMTKELYFKNWESINPRSIDLDSYNFNDGNCLQFNNYIDALEFAKNWIGNESDSIEFNLNKIDSYFAICEKNLENNRLSSILQAIFSLPLNKVLQVKKTEDLNRPLSRLIDVDWYKNTISRFISDNDKVFVSEYPLVFYFASGYQFPVSLSPYIAVNNSTPITLELAIIQLSLLFQNKYGDRYEENISNTLFDYIYYKEQLIERGIETSLPFVLHYLLHGYSQKLYPTRNWSNVFYQKLIQIFPVSIPSHLNYGITGAGMADLKIVLV